MFQQDFDTRAILILMSILVFFHNFVGSFEPKSLLSSKFYSLLMKMILNYSIKRHVKNSVL